MKKEDFIAQNKGKDGIVGRPIRLNKVTLKSRPNKDYAEIIFWGDVHLGHPQCEKEKAQEMLDYALKKKIYVLLTGDLIESGLRTSIGDSIYFQKLNPQKQMEEVVEMLEPLAQAGLIIGLHSGNHENRITKATSIDISKIMAKQLDVPYLGYSCWSALRVGKQNYSLYSTHGSSGARFKHTKLKAVIDIASWISADIIAMGHVHSIGSEAIIKQYIDWKDKVVKEGKCYVCLTGSYLGWDKSYAQMKNMPITKIGSPKAKLFFKRKDVHFSL